MRLWIDTDVGDNPDDAVALLCARAHPSIEIVGVSTCDGDTAHRAQLVRTLVDVPVVVAGGVDDVPKALADAQPEAVLAIGPLTNVAAAMRSGVALPPLAVMGGAARPTRHAGRMQAIEHNFATDPLAARAVVANARDLLLVPLDVTTAIALEPDDEMKLLAAAPALASHIARWRLEVGDEMPLVLHDPLALLALSGEPIVNLQTRHLLVDRDGRLVQRADGPLHSIVVGAEPRMAIKRVLTLLG